MSGPLAAAALFAGSTIGPRLADTVTSYPAEAARVVAAVAAERGASTWAGMFLMVGLALLVPFFAGITAAIRSRGALLATMGGTWPWSARPVGRCPNGPSSASFS